VGQNEYGEYHKGFRSEEMELKGTWKVLEVPRSIYKHKMNSKETHRVNDQYATCLETTVAQQS
jgi:hypothetical protein